MEEGIANSRVQLVADLISSAFSIDVGVVDREMIAIAGTGTYKRYIGITRPKDSYVVKSLQSGEAFVLKEATYGKNCYKCEIRKTCPYTMVMYQPINEGNQALACLMLLASNPHHHQTLTQKLDRFQKELSNMSFLFSNILTQERIVNHSSNTTTEINQIIDIFDEGLIVSNKIGKITHINATAKNFFKCKNDEILGQEIDKLLFGEGCNIKLSNSCCCKKNKLSTFLGRNDLFFTVKPMEMFGSFVGYVVRFGKKSPVKPFFNPILSGDKNPFAKVVGSSIAIRKTINDAMRIAGTGSTILLLGETGTGKDLFAKGIHDASMRSGGPFITLNCSTLPDNLLESEMFGYEEGAFTGAKKGGKDGKFYLADKGTLFLDEIGDLPLLLQAKLLRVIEDGRVEKIGSTKNIKVDVRIIAATNHDLLEMVNNGSFRKDLYYRLNVIPIYLPPLRERKEDIPLLVEHFMNQLAIGSGSTKTISREVEHLFLNYPWPGNVRELKNAAEHLFQIVPNKMITVEDLPRSMKTLFFHKIRETDINTNPNSLENIKLLERSAIEKALSLYGNTTEGKKKAAKSLGISLTTLYRRLHVYDSDDRAAGRKTILRIVVKYCGGCNPRYDRTALVDEFFRKAATAGAVRVLLGSPADFVLIANGCISACADNPNNYTLANRSIVLRCEDDLHKALEQFTQVQIH